MLKAQDKNTQKERKTISRKHRRSIQKPNQYDRSPINLNVIMHLLSMYCRTETRKNNNKEAIIVILMLKTQTNPNQKTKTIIFIQTLLVIAERKVYSSFVSIFHQWTRKGDNRCDKEKERFKILNDSMADEDENERKERLSDQCRINAYIF